MENIGIILNKIVQDNGKEIYNDKVRLCGLIADLVQSEKMRRLLVRAVKEDNIAQKILQLQQYDNAEQQSRILALKNVFKDRNFLEEKIAFNVIDFFALGLQPKPLSTKTSDKNSIPLLHTKKDIKPISTKVTFIDGEWKDEYGAKYSADRTKLIKAPNDLKQYDILEGTSVICDEAFFYFCEDDDCSSLQSINIPNSVKAIGERAFGNCKSLQSINIPDSVTTIGDSTFYGCSSLQSINIPDSVTAIGNWAFGNCSSLQSINIPDGVTIIGKYAFCSCSSLQSINIPDNVTVIGERAFGNCKSLQSINIPDNVTVIGDGAFYECRSLQSINCNNDYYQSINGVLFNKDKTVLIAYPASMNDVMFYIPDSVTAIGENAFMFCSSLQSINIPNSVTIIGNSAFYYCKSLQSINIPDSVTTIGDSTFYGCSSLQSINIPDSVTTIGDSTFYGCSSLQSINIPDSVTAIGNWAFGNCSSLQSINIPDGVTSIGDWAFGNCSSLQSINIPDSVMAIGDGAFNVLIGHFWVCSLSLQSINIPKGTSNKFSKLVDEDDLIKKLVEK